jgi:PilZ domain
VTGAPPRLGDSVHVALGFRDLGALLRGTVYHVTTAADAMATGSSGFAVRFPVYPSAGRQQLIELLTAARHAGVTIKPPPTRHAVRFPVCWPVQVAIGDDSFHADALDVSERGMFLAIQGSIHVGAEIDISVPMEEGESVTARARVARLLPAREASPRGLRGGTGLELTSMSEPDRALWTGFLDRVRRRTERRVVVGASPGRIDEIASALTAAGYSVTTGSDAGVLVRLADLEPRPPDAVVIEAGLAAQGPDHWLEQVFSARQVPCVTVHGDGRRTRCVVDRLLQVAA